MTSSTDRFLAWGLGALAFLLAASGVLRYGLTWDEPTYFRFARLQRRWLADSFGAFAHPSALADLFSAKTIAQVWLQHPEKNGHPPLNEVWQAIVSFPFHAAGLHDTQAFRSAIALLLGLTVVFLYRLLRTAVSRRAATAGVLVYLGIPAVWAHGHLGATETMQCFFWVLLPLVFHHARLKGGRWCWAWLAVCALSFAAKFTNVLIPLCVLGTAGLLGSWRRGRFWYLAALGLLLGPALLPILDPFFWPWQGGLERFVDYLKQTTTRGQWIPINVFYLNQSWGFHPPWHYRIVELSAALPLPVLLLFLPGLYFGGASLFGQLRRQAIDNWPAAFAVGGLFLTFITGLLPATPNHDGTRQFVYVFVPVALLAGLGVDRILSSVDRRGRSAGPGYGLGSRLQVAATSGLLLVAASAFALSIWWEPWGLSYHSEWIGGVRGAWRRGFEVTYWGESITPRMLTQVADLASQRGADRAVEGARILSIPKLNYFGDAEDFWKPLVPASPSGGLGRDVAPAYFEKWVTPELREERGPALRLTFLNPPDGILLFPRRATVSGSFTEVLERLESCGDLKLLGEERVQDIPLSRLYQLIRISPVLIPEDPERRTWYQPASLDSLVLRGGQRSSSGSRGRSVGGSGE